MNIQKVCYDTMRRRVTLERVERRVKHRIKDRKVTHYITVH